MTADPVGVGEEQSGLDADDCDVGQRLVLRVPLEVDKLVRRARNLAEHGDVRTRGPVEEQEERHRDADEVDFVPKPVMTGFLFGLGLVVALGQLPKIFGVPAGSGGFFSQLWDLVGELGETSGWTLVLGAGGAAALVLLQRLAPQLPGTLIVLAGSIVVSAALDLASRGVDVVGELPDAAPDFAIPDVSWGDLADLLPAALGVMIVTAEAAAVSRSIASAQGYEVDVNRDVVALGGSNLLAGLSSGFVQSGGASQTLAAERAGGRRSSCRSSPPA